MTILPAIKKQQIWFALLPLVFAMMLMMACEKEDTRDFVNAAEVASVHLAADLDATYYFAVFHRAIYDTALINNDTAIIDSAQVSRSFDAISGITSYLFDYGEGTLCQDLTIKSGTIEALLDKDISQPGAVFSATFSNFKIDNTSIVGIATYSVEGALFSEKLKFVYNVALTFINQNTTLQYHSNKIVYWVEGLENPSDIEDQSFTIEGTSGSTYVNPTNLAIPEADISGLIEGEWEAALRCHKLIQKGNINIEVSHQNLTDTMNGNFIDTDLDGCGDKVMLKNSDDFGYPYYI